jgi:sterol 24-C-methyltransferase
MLDTLFDGSPTSLVAAAVVSIVSLNVVFSLAKSFQRDSVGNSFGNVVTGSVSLLQNKDSVLKREEVKDSMDGYDELFAGARKDVGSLHKEESIEKRQKEYQTMVNSFYNLVTDFYEWGWGQVRCLGVLCHWI